MTITHAISTERLVNVLQSIALKQQTGCLSVARERSHTHEAEKGNIFFERGDTVFALTAQESGETALSRILHWKNVSYTFIEGMRYFPERTTSSKVTRQLTRPLHTRDMSRLTSIKAAEGRHTPPIGIPALPSVIPQQPPLEMLETQLLPVLNMAELPMPVPPEMALRRPLPLRQSPCVQHDTGKHEQTSPNHHTGSESHELFSATMGVASVFRALTSATSPAVLSRLERRERIVLLLLNGKRTLRDVALLVHRSEIDVARTLVRLLKQGYIECIGGD